VHLFMYDLARYDNTIRQYIYIYDDDDEAKFTDTV
jgi:hypothetical protein